MIDLASVRRAAFDAGYRMLGTRAEADDVAQESLLRIQPALERGEVTNAEAYATTVATRIALDHLRSARVRREAYHGPWLPEPLIEPIDTAEVADDVSFALLVVLETLAPVERAAFLLREVFGHDYAEVAAALDRSEPAVRQLVHRARERVAAGRPRLPVDRDQHRRLLERFLDAAGGGDLNALTELLADDVRLVSDGGATVKAARHPIVGRDRVARFLRKVWRRRHGGDWDRSIANVNGQPGWVVARADEIGLVGTIETDGERITAIHWVLNPEKLGAQFGALPTSE